MRERLEGSRCLQPFERRLHDRADRQTELAGELEVALVVGRDGHDGPGAVANEHVIGDPDRDLLLVHRIDGVGAGEHARLLLGQLRPFQIALAGRVCLVGFHGRLVLARGDEVDERMLGRKHHVGGAEEGVRPRREHTDRAARRRWREGEIHLGPLATADPVALHLLDGLRPVDQVQVIKQAFGIIGDAQQPLP